MAAQSPIDVDRIFADGLRNGDADSVLALYEPGAILIQPGSGAVLTGLAPIRGLLETLVAGKADFAMSPRVVAQAGDLAILYNDYRGTITGPDGQKAPVEGKSVEVVRRQSDGSWKFVFDDPNGRG